MYSGLQYIVNFFSLVLNVWSFDAYTWRLPFYKEVYLQGGQTRLHIPQYVD